MDDAPASPDRAFPASVMPSTRGLSVPEGGAPRRPKKARSGEAHLPAPRQKSPNCGQVEFRSSEGGNGAVGGRCRTGRHRVTPYVPYIGGMWGESRSVFSEFGRLRAHVSAHLAKTPRRQSPEDKETSSDKTDSREAVPIEWGGRPSPGEAKGPEPSTSFLVRETPSNVPRSSTRMFVWTVRTRAGGRSTGGRKTGGAEGGNSRPRVVDRGSSVANSNAGRTTPRAGRGRSKDRGSWSRRRGRPLTRVKWVPRCAGCGFTRGK